MQKLSSGRVAQMLLMILSTLLPPRAWTRPAVASTAVASILAVVFPALPVMATKVTLSSRRRCQAAIPGSRRELIFHQPGTRWAAVRRGESIGSALQRELEVVPPQGPCGARLEPAAVTPPRPGQPPAPMGEDRKSRG